MILTCPQCATRYHVDPASLGPEGRSVRCANCGSRWLAEPPADAPRPVELPATTHAAPRKPGVSGVGRNRTSGSATLVGWLIGVLVVLILASTIIGRNEIVDALPASASIYQKLGLPVTKNLGLQFENVTSLRLAERGVAILVIEGQIVNVSEHQQAVPPVKVTLLDDGGRQLEHELFEAKAQALGAGQKTTFSGRLVNPTSRARNFSVTFDVGS
jgi:predicted Zn finger-like uncharacterized protein